jgi:hypothetical protein
MLNMNDLKNDEHLLYVRSFEVINLFILNMTFKIIK